MTEINAGIVQSVRDRLYKLSGERNESLQSLFVRYALERFLYRLGKSKHSGQLILKGAFLFTLWTGQYYRTTKDLDMLVNGSDSQDRIREMFDEICSVDVEPDGLVYEFRNVMIEEIREGQTYQGLRVKFRALLGKAVIPLQLDLGFGDAVVPKPEVIEYPSILSFPRPCILAYPPESIISEKVEAMVKLGLDNSRMKDFYDVFSLLKVIDLDREALKKAIEETFRRRHTGIPKDIPQALTGVFATDEVKKIQWRSFIGKNELTNAPEDLATVIDEIKSLVLPIFAEINRKP